MTTTERAAAERGFLDAAERIPTPLYKIPYAVEAVLADVEAGTLDEAEAEAQLNLLAGEFRLKALSTAAVIRNYESAADACDAEIARLQERQARLERRAAWLRDYVLRNMQAIPGLREIPGGVFTLLRKTNPPKVLVVNQELIPDEFMRQPAAPKIPPPAPDKNAITRYWKDTGADVPGTRVVQDEVLVIS
jgi:hypothetical protein